jgi:phosphate transport system substrate-binding protein
MKLQAALILLALAFVALAVRWGEIRIDEPPATHRIVLLADDTTVDFARRLGADYQRATPDTGVNVQTPRGDRTLELVRMGNADAAILSHWLSPDELDLQTHTLALDALCLIVHKSNPIVGMSPNQVRDVYSGQVNEWSGLGVFEGRILPIVPPTDQFITVTFADAFDLDPAFMPTAQIADTEDDIIDRVAADPMGIGVVSLKIAHERMIEASPIRLLPIGGVRPMPANIRSGDYPYVLPINLVTRVDPGDQARALLTLAQQGAARDIARAMRLVEVSPRISTSATSPPQVP